MSILVAGRLGDAWHWGLHGALIVDPYDNNKEEHFMQYLSLSLCRWQSLAKNIRELKAILYGNGESEPVTEACVQLTQEFFKENTLRLLIIHLPKLNLEVYNS